MQSIQSMTLADRLFADVRSGSKRATIRWREGPIKPGRLEFVSDPRGDDRIEVIVTRSTAMPLSNVADFLGRSVEWPDKALLEGMREHYPDIGIDSLVDVIEFALPSDFDGAGYVIREAHGSEDYNFIMSLNVRVIEAAQAPVHQFGEIKAFQDCYTREKLSIDGQSAACFIAEDTAGTRLGYVHVTKAVDDVTLHPAAYVSLLAVIPQAARGGVGRTLLEKAEVWARSEGLEYSWIEVFSSNVPALKFYEKCGYAPDTIRVVKEL